MKHLRAIIIAVILAAILGFVAPTPTRANDSCSDAYDAALSAANSFWNNCTADNGYTVILFLCVPTYTAAVYDAGQAYYGCIGAPIMQ